MLNENLEIMRRLRAPKALPADPQDMMRLYQAVRTHRPNIVIEFGAGYSTMAIITAMVENNHGFLFSVEDQPDWAMDVARTFKTKMFKDYGHHLRVVSTRKYSSQVFDTEGWHYHDCPKVVPDMIYLDGPELTTGGDVTLSPAKYLISRPKGHIIRMYIDGREASVEYYKSPLWRGRAHPPAMDRWHGFTFGQDD